MKILFIFCDMLRAELQQSFNPQIKDASPVDKWMRKLGGTAYRNCYTPAPDTGRSLGCLYSGRYPERNGCTKRSRWPKYFLNDGIGNLNEFLSEEDFDFYTTIQPNSLLYGLFPEVHSAKHVNEYTLDLLIKRKKEIIESEKCLVFLDLEDYHFVVGEYGGFGVADHKGNTILSNCLEAFFSAIPKETFDYILLFSDHGCQLNQDVSVKNHLLFTDDTRSKIAMFLHKKGDEGLTFCDELRSICDVHPTVIEILGHNPNDMNLDGVSFFQKVLDRNVVIEDIYGWQSKGDERPDHWAVRTDSHFFYDNLHTQALFKVDSPGSYEEVSEINPVDSDLYRKMIESVSSEYASQKKETEVWRKINPMRTEAFAKMASLRHWSIYSDGSSRPPRFQERWMGRIGQVYRLIRRKWPKLD